MSVLGLDIGGANIKAATTDGRTCSVPFPLWKQPERLAAMLAELVAMFVDCDTVAVTMTGELADCFTTKADGVRHIVAAVVQAAGSRRTLFWTTDGRFIAPQVVGQHVLAVAAANWHALATWVGQRAATGSALLIDIGTTTTDIIPLRDGRPVALGQTDRERLTTRELVYTGVRRTPLCAIAKAAPWENSQVGVAAELFATTLDAYLLQGDIAEDAADIETANGRPATIASAHDRIARMVCGDREEVSHEQAVQLARFFTATQQQHIAGAVRTVLARQTASVTTVIVSGSGEFLARRVVASIPELSAGTVISLTDELAPEIATAACAYAVAQLGKRI
ncbi:MAG: hydantoinase/oxoprolinase family protein [Planctomycetaceae bacterium]|nr:hydantoinase/oxoprolinase family protein [Planctomycetaceae bacterium]